MYLFMNMKLLNLQIAQILNMILTLNIKNIFTKQVLITICKKLVRIRITKAY